jgi:hypothetical protein
MRSKMRILQYSVLVAVLFIVGWNYAGRSTPTTGKFQDLTLTVATPRTRYLEVEPIPIVVSLKNETEMSIVGHRALGFDSGYLRLDVTRNGEPHEIGQLSLSQKLVEAQTHEFKPGDEVKRMERLNLKLNEVFPVPGTYELTARLSSGDGKETISSKPISVEIAKPIGLDAQALKFIRANDEPAFFFTGAQVINHPEKLQTLEHFVLVFGQSAYGDEASLLLGKAQFAKGENQKARAQFERLSKKSDFAFAGEASEYLKRVDRSEKKVH